MATLPLPNVEASITELRRAVALGARGINGGTGDFGGDSLVTRTADGWRFKRFQLIIDPALFSDAKRVVAAKAN